METGVTRMKVSKATGTSNASSHPTTSKVAHIAADMPHATSEATATKVGSAKITPAEMGAPQISAPHMHPATAEPASTASKSTTEASRLTHARQQ